MRPNFHQTLEQKGILMIIPRTWLLVCRARGFRFLPCGWGTELQQVIYLANRMDENVRWHVPLHESATTVPHRVAAPSMLHAMRA